MARIRTIKPDFWDSPDTARASLRARLFYIAMWNWADDWGIGTANAKQLVGFAFPNDDDISAADFPTLRKEVQNAYGVVFYEVAGRPYYCIPAWDKHQRTERKARGSNPPPPNSPQAADQQEYDSGGTTDDSDGNSADTAGEMSLGTGEQGNRGTGEVERHVPPEPDRFNEFWTTYPRRDDKVKAQAAYKSARKKASQDEIIAGAHRYATDPNRDDGFTKLPTSWLNAGSWANGPLPDRRAGPTKPTTLEKATGTVAMGAEMQRQMDARNGTNGHSYPLEISYEHR